MLKSPLPRCLQVTWLATLAATAMISSPVRADEAWVEQIELLGVEILCNRNVGSDITLEALRDSYDAVIIAAGTLDNQGRYSWSIPVPRDNVLLGLALVWQGTAGPTLGRQTLSNPDTYVHGL